MPDDEHGKVTTGTAVVRRWTWIGACVLVFAVLAQLLLRVLVVLSPVLIPLAVAVLLTALLWPLVAWLTRLRVPRPLAAGLVLLVALAALGAMLALSIDALVGGAGDLGTTLRDAVTRVRDWLVHGPLSLRETQVDALVDNLVGVVTGQTERIVGGATATATAVGGFLAGLVLALFALFFFLADGERIWRGALRLVPARLRDEADAAGRRALHALTGFTRATLAVALVDAAAIGTGLALLGVPMVVPLTSLVFLGAFVPYVGAFVAGSVAVLVALVSGGPVTALLVLALNIGVQELEGDVLQPFLLGRVVRLHPLVVVVAIGVGVVVAGLVGALFAVPVVLAARAVLESRAGERRVG